MGGREEGGPGDRGGHPAVCDASPLIALDQIGRLDLLPGLFGTVVVPPAVSAETPRIAKPDWLVERRLREPIPDWLVAARLGPGETEAIALALQLRAEQVVLDERRATRIARGEGLRVVGTLGVLLLAKSAGLVPAIRPDVAGLRATGFHLAPWLVADVLATAGEDA